MEVVNRRCLHPVNLPSTIGSTSLGFSFPPATPRADLLLRALLVLFESADSVIMFGGLG